MFDPFDYDRRVLDDEALDLLDRATRQHDTTRTEDEF